MKNYEIRVYPKIADDNSVYWTAYYPSIPGCIGGGDTQEEAMKEAKENLEIYLEYLEEECKKLPLDDYKSDYNGKIALRISKSTHKRIAQIAEDEGISINLLLNNAIENYLGIKTYDMNINEKIDDLKDVADSSFLLQNLNASKNKKILDGITEIQNYIIEGVQYV